jgi:beta-lactamase regulating signal transducer with metallopeptidase domain
MIATFMIFGLVVGALFAAAGAVLEPVLLRGRLQVRWLWLVAMVGTVYVLVAAIVATSPRTVGVSVDTAPRPFSSSSAAPNMSLGTQASPSALRSSQLRIDASLARASANAAVFDRPLLVLWFSCSLVLALWLIAVTIATTHASGASRLGSPMPGANDIVITRDVGPAAIGALRTRILLPQWVLDLEPSLRALVLQHEREHLLARDPILLLCSTVLIVTLPWQLPLWWMARRLRLAIEYDCDARVLRTLPDIRRYASLLVLVSAKSRPSRTSVPFFAHLVFMSTASARAALRQRILVMTQPRRATRPLSLFVSMAGAATITLVAASLPLPARHINAQAVSPTASAPAGTRPSPVDSVIEFRYLVEAQASVQEHGVKPFVYLLEHASLFADTRARTTTFHVASKSGRPTTVELTIERGPKDDAHNTDRRSVRTPFSLVRGRGMPVLHIRSVHGDTILITSPAAVRPLWAPKISGLHFLLWGVNSLGVVQR